jgi:polyribonucleotide nucleotidyltransferase
MSLSKKLKHISASLLLIASSSAIANTSLPLSPEKITQPYPEVEVETIHSAQSLISEFKEHQYQLSNITKNSTVPVFFVENLPDDLNSLPVEEKISGFIRLLLPTIIDVNKHIITVRNEAISLSKQPKTEWTKEESLCASQSSLATHKPKQCNSIRKKTVRRGYSYSIQNTNQWKKFGKEG